MTAVRARGRVYLTDGDRLCQGPQLVCGVQSDAVHTNRLLVLLAVQLQRLQVQVTAGLALPFADPPQLWVCDEGLADVAESAVGDRLAFRESLPAQRTNLPDELHTSFQTFLTEAVATGQHHGVLEDVPTHRTRQLLLEGQRLIRHLFVHALGHGFVRGFFFYNFTFVLTKTIM